jgi:hypothetical protein
LFGFTGGIGSGSMTLRARVDFHHSFPIALQKSNASQNKVTPAKIQTL